MRTRVVPEARRTSTVPEARRTSTAALAVMLALGIGLVLILRIGSGGQAGTGHGARHQPVGGPVAPAMPTARTLRLVTGSVLVNGIYTDYPRTKPAPSARRSSS